MRDVVTSGISPDGAVKTVANFMRHEVEAGASVREAAVKATDKYELRSIAQAEWCYDQHHVAA